MFSHLFDTHFHLDLFESYLDVVKGIEENQIYVIAVTNLPVLYTTLKNKINSKFIRPALGFHPELLEAYKFHIPEMWKLLEDAKYIGEVGLDYKNGSGSKLVQKSFFIDLVERCEMIGGKILSVHSRSSAEDIVSIIGNNFHGKIIMHWYSGNKVTLFKAIENGYYFSVNDAMLKSNSGRENIKLLPLDKILLETDGPFIQYNNRPFTPLDLGVVTLKLAQLKKCGNDEIKSILWDNFKNIL